MSGFERAIDAMLDRKKAILGIEDEEVAAAGFTLEDFRMIFVGMDVDLDEALAHARGTAITLTIPILAGVVPPGMAIEGSWLDGFASGVLYEQMRQEGE